MAVSGKKYGKGAKFGHEKAKKPSGFGVRVGPAPWQATYGLYIAGSEVIDDMKVVAREMEEKWGKGRLRMVVPAGLREKFDRQRYLTNQAVWHGELEDVKRECGRMINAWRALDKTAEASGASVKPVEQWEVVLGCGTTLIVVKALEDASAVKIDGRKAVVWSLDEVAALVDEQKAVLMAKMIFPGAEVISASTTIEDPLNAISTSLADLDDDLSDMMPVNPLMG